MSDLGSLRTRSPTKNPDKCLFISSETSNGLEQLFCIGLGVERRSWQYSREILQINTKLDTHILYVHSQLLTCSMLIGRLVDVNERQRMKVAVVRDRTMVLSP